MGSTGNRRSASAHERAPPLDSPLGTQLSHYRLTQRLQRRGRPSARHRSTDTADNVQDLYSATGTGAACTARVGATSTAGDASAARSSSLKGGTPQRLWPLHCDASATGGWHCEDSWNWRHSLGKDRRDVRRRLRKALRTRLVLTPQASKEVSTISARLHVRGLSRRHRHGRHCRDTLHIWCERAGAMNSTTCAGAAITAGTGVMYSTA